MNRTRLLAGLGLVAAGVLWLLDAAGVLEFGPLLATWWPIALVAFGASQLLDRPPHLGGATVMIVIGLVVLGLTTGVLSASVLAVLWPIALVLVGVWLLIGRRGRVPTGDDTVSTLVVFSGKEISSHSDGFKGGALTAIFGGIELDLRAARLDPDGARIDLTALFGGVEITVPEGWRVRMRGPVLFAGATDETSRGGHAPAGGPILDLRLFVLFGGAEVKARASTRTNP